MSNQSLDLQVKRSIWILLAMLAAAILVYAAWFGGLHGRGISEDPGNWGEFGDYIGGFLNPIIAFGAFYWLASSVSIQKKELQETREALKSTQEAQASQARSTLLAAHLQNLNLKIQKALSDLDYQRRSLAAVLEWGNRNGFQNSIVTANHTGEQADIAKQRIEANIACLLEELDELYAQLLVWDFALKNPPQ